MSSLSIVEYFSKNEKGRCGYCKGKKTSQSHGLWGHFLTPQDYQDLIDRGWRRSGKYCYKPVMHETCCPQYAIKCLALQFKPSKSHKKALKTFRNFILNDAGASRIKPVEVLPLADNVCSSDSENENENEDDQDSDDFQNKQVTSVEKKLKFDSDDCVEKTNPEASGVIPKTTESEKSPVKPSKAPYKAGLGPDPNKPKPRKAKEIRREKALLKAKGEKGLPAKNKNNEVKLEDLTEFFFDQKQKGKHKLELRIVRATKEDDRFKESFDESFQVFRKYQIAIHKDKPKECTPNQFNRFLCSSPIVEGQPINPVDARRFPPNFFPSSYGGYHQQYLLDGKIICVGVLDILPNCISSVYLYYDPDYSFLGLGTVSALLEIAYLRHIHRHWSPQIDSYYMGYYIHSCPKMKYKAKYLPSQLLCPQTFDWIQVEDCFPLLDQSKYSRLNTLSDKADQLTIQPTKEKLGYVAVLFYRRPMPYFQYSTTFSEPNMNEEDLEVAEYFTLVGEKVSRSMLLHRSSR